MADLRLRQVIHQFDTDGREYTLVELVRPPNEEYGETEDVPLRRMGRDEAAKRGFTLEKITSDVAVANMKAKEMAEAAQAAAESERDAAKADSTEMAKQLADANAARDAAMRVASNAVVEHQATKDENVALVKALDEATARGMKARPNPVLNKLTFGLAGN